MKDVLVFGLGGKEWELLASKVRQVLAPRPVTRVPGADPLLRGVVAWRATVLPVLAPGARLACTDLPPGQGVLLVVEHSGELVALAVDSVNRFESKDEAQQALDLEWLLDER